MKQGNKTTAPSRRGELRQAQERCPHLCCGGVGYGLHRHRRGVYSRCTGPRQERLRHGSEGLFLRPPT